MTDLERVELALRRVAFFTMDGRTRRVIEAIADELLRADMEKDPDHDEANR